MRNKLLLARKMYRDENFHEENSKACQIGLELEAIYLFYWVFCVNKKINLEDLKQTGAFICNRHKH